jgi:hypothetical protein
MQAFDHGKVVGMLDEKFGLRQWHGLIYTRASGAKPEVKIVGNDTMAREVMVARN